MIHSLLDKDLETTLFFVIDFLCRHEALPLVRLESSLIFEWDESGCVPEHDSPRYLYVCMMYRFLSIQCVCFVYVYLVILR